MAPFEHSDLLALSEQFRNASVVTPELMTDVIETACERFPSSGQIARTARIRDLIAARACTDAALALIDLELLSWRIRRIAYDGDEWHCALSHQRELPDWLDQSIEGRHADLAMAILSVFVEVRAALQGAGKPNVPAASRQVGTGYIPLCCENFA